MIVSDTCGDTWFWTLGPSGATSCKLETKQNSNKHKPFTPLCALVQLGARLPRTDLKSAARKGVGVQVPLRAPLKTSLKMRF
jgi:hypothetical protein